MLIQSRTPYFYGKPDNRHNTEQEPSNQLLCGDMSRIDLVSKNLPGHKCFLEVVRIERLVLSYKDLEAGRPQLM